jgi:DNA gyrase/topoisomerase IV subunit A
MKKNKPDLIEFPLSNDKVFKMILTTKPRIAIGLVKAFVPDLKDIDINMEVTYLRNENDNGINYASTLFDVKFEVAKNLFELEMQKRNPTYNLKDRIFKYYLDLLKEAFPINNNYYHKPSYCIWFIGFKLFDDNIVIREYSLSNIETKNKLINDSSIIIIEIAKFKKPGYNLNSWYDIFVTNDLSVIKEENDDAMKELVIELKKINSDEIMKEKLRQERYREEERLAEEFARKEKEEKYKAELKQSRTELTQTKEELKKIKKEINEAKKEINEAKKEINETLLKIAKCLKDNGSSIDFISSTTGLPKEEIEKL